MAQAVKHLLPSLTTNYPLAPTRTHTHTHKDTDIHACNAMLRTKAAGIGFCDTVSH